MAPFNGLDAGRTGEAADGAVVASTFERSPACDDEVLVVRAVLPFVAAVVAADVCVDVVVVTPPAVLEFEVSPLLFVVFAVLLDVSVLFELEEDVGGASLTPNVNES
jgi:hypothetical protein